MQTVSNAQAFQSIYMNPNAKWEEKIIVHDPIFEDEISGVIALKSYRLENCIGLVIGAPLDKLRLFRKTLKEVDKKEKWGKLPISDILKNIIDLATQIGAIVTYLQNKTEGTPTEEIPSDSQTKVKKTLNKKVKKGKSA